MPLKTLNTSDNDSHCDQLWMVMATCAYGLKFPHNQMALAAQHNISSHFKKIKLNKVDAFAFQRLKPDILNIIRPKPCS